MSENEEAWDSVQGDTSPDGSYQRLPEQASYTMERGESRRSARRQSTNTMMIEEEQRIMHEAAIDTNDFFPLQYPAESMISSHQRITRGPTVIESVIHEAATAEEEESMNHMNMSKLILPDLNYSCDTSNSD